MISIVAAVELKKDPTKRGWGRTIFGLIMGAAATIALAVIAVT